MVHIRSVDGRRCAIMANACSSFGSATRGFSRGFRMGQSLAIASYFARAFPARTESRKLKVVVSGQSGSADAQ